MVAVPCEWCVAVFGHQAVPCEWCVAHSGSSGSGCGGCCCSGRFINVARQ